jgi:DNA repair protein RadC
VAESRGRDVRDVPGSGVRLAERPALQSPADAARLFTEYIGASDREIFAAAFLTVRHRIIALQTVSVGCLTSSIVHPRELFKVAIVSNAAALVVSHNHPSGDPEPSADDLALTRRLRAAGELLGIELLDHVIVGDARYVSLKERGLL